MYRNTPIGYCLNTILISDIRQVSDNFSYVIDKYYRRIVFRSNVMSIIWIFADKQ